MITKQPFTLKDQKIKCECGCPMTLYVTDFEHGDITIATEPNARKGFKYTQGVVINRSKMFDVLNTEE
jgi:hypothetical protein